MFKGAKLALLVLAALGLALPVRATSSGASVRVAAHVCSSSFASTTLSAGTDDPTTAKSTLVSGTAESYAAIDVTRNGSVIVSLYADGAGNFSASIPLLIGANNLKVHASDSCGHSNDSGTIVINRLQVPPPPPVFVSPGDGLTTSDPHQTVTGTAEPAAVVELRLDDILLGTLTADSDGNFSSDIRLKAGRNILTAIARNAAGPGLESLPLRMTYTPKVAPPAPPAPVSTAPRALRPNLSAPSFVSPPSGTKTVASSVWVELAAVPGSTVAISRNGVVVATVIMPDGSAKLDLPLAKGGNIFFAQARLNGAVSSVSVPLEVQRLGRAPLAPVITDPKDHSSSNSEKIKLRGKAEPGQSVEILRDGEVAASAMAAEDGSFTVSVLLKPGLNTLLARARGDDGVSVSSPTNVYYQRSGSALGIGQNIISFLVAPAIISGQFFGSLVSDLASKPLERSLLAAGGLMAATSARGLIGLELILAALGWVWVSKKLISRHVISGKLIDSVTGKGVPLARIMSNRMMTFSNLKGEFKISRPPGSTLKVPSPHYSVVKEVDEQTVRILLEPTGLTIKFQIVDLLIATLAWAVLLLAAAVTIATALKLRTAGWAVLAVCYLAVVTASVLSLALQPKLRWGRVVSSGKPLQGALVELTSDGGSQVASYLTDSHGAYTLHAPPGNYQMTVRKGKNVLARESIRIVRKPAFFGFGIKL